jgi:hypothetical protein
MQRVWLTDGASDLFKQFSKPFAEPLILKFASGDLAIHPAFVLKRALVSCPSTLGRQFHSAVSQNIDDELSEEICLSVA